jgi:hypothetical protein
MKIFKNIQSVWPIMKKGWGGEGHITSGYNLGKEKYCQVLWLTPIILATQEADIRRIAV